jgi:hypothetical protein
MAKNLKKWIAAQKKYRLSDKHIQMARELGLNPDKFSQLNNHDQGEYNGLKTIVSILSPLIDFLCF